LVVLGRGELSVLSVLGGKSSSGLGGGSFVLFLSIFPCLSSLTKDTLGGGDGSSGSGLGLLALEVFLNETVSVGSLGLRLLDVSLVLGLERLPIILGVKSSQESSHVSSLDRGGISGGLNDITIDERLGYVSGGSVDSDEGKGGECEFHVDILKVYRQIRAASL
jgi:hypothetical protein